MQGYLTVKLHTENRGEKKQVSLYSENILGLQYDEVTIFYYCAMLSVPVHIQLTSHRECEHVFSSL